MKTKLIIVLSAFQLFSFSAFPATYSLTNIQLPKVTGVLGFTNADSAPTGMAKVAVSLINLSNVVANLPTSGGSSNGFYILNTNGVGTNLWVCQPLTLAGSSMKTWIEWTNPPVNPTNQPPDWTNNACTNLAGPYYESATNGFFTNACGFGITIGDGGDTNMNGGWESNNLAQVTNSGMRYLKVIHVAGNSMDGDYTWTNGVFWLNGVPTNCTPKTVHFNNAANTWVARNGSTFYNNSAGAALLGTWNGATYTTNSYDTNSGFPYAYWPGFAIAISGSGTAALNGIYEFHHREDTVITLTNLNSCSIKTAYGFDTSFVNKTNPAFTCTWNVDAYWPGSNSMEMQLTASNGTPAASKYYGWTGSNIVYGWNLGGPLSDAVFARRSQMTNAIVVVQPLPGGITGGITGGNPPRLTYQAGTNCTYLQTLLQYSEFVDAMNTLYCQPSGTNCGHIFLSTNGTAYVYAAGTLYYTIPQSNTKEWRPCP